jgi:hypothetical protein
VVKFESEVDKEPELNHALVFVRVPDARELA